MSDKITAYKGFDKDLRCRGFQYEVGKEYEIDGEVKVCKRGFHACAAPLDVFKYYTPANSRYCVVEQSGRLSYDGKDSKIASSKIKIGAEINLTALANAHVEWVKSKSGTECDDGKGAAAGDCGAATAGDCGAAAAGHKGAAAVGCRGVATSKGSVSVGVNGCGLARGVNVKARGGMGAILTICVEDKRCDIAEWKSFVVDGETIKADTWYTLKDGEIVEVEG